MNDDRLGPYRLLRRLGEGGMGVVHLAVDPQGRQVAVKVLRGEVAGDEVARRRLSREVETMRRVRSKYIAEVVDADVTGHRPYIVTRFVPGRPLDEIVKDDGPLDLPALIRVAHGVASALAAVHSVGVIHRDLKPGNVMILDGEPVLIDFGIAQAVDATRLTQTGMFIGTPGYLAPEIIEGQEAGPEVDIHAWAGTLLFAATGQPPFGKGTLEMIFYNITAGKADVSAAPAELQPLLKSAFQRNPAKRPKAAELAEQTARMLPAPPPGTPDEISTVPRPDGQAPSRLPPRVTDKPSYDISTPPVTPRRLIEGQEPQPVAPPQDQPYVSLLPNQGDPWPTRRVTPEELRQIQREGAAVPPSQPWPHHQANSHPAPAPHGEADVPTRRVRPDSPDYGRLNASPDVGRPTPGVPLPGPMGHGAVGPVPETPDYGQPGPTPVQPPPYIPAQPQYPPDPRTKREPYIPASAPGKVLQRSKAYGVAGAMLLVIMIVAAVLAPVIVAAVAIPFAVLLRAADLAQPQLTARRAAGAAALDVIRVFAYPAALARSVGITLALVLYAVILGLPVTLLLTVVAGVDAYYALAWGAAVALWTVCAGPGVEGPGKQMRRTLSSLVPSRTAAMVMAGVFAVGAALSLIPAYSTFVDEPKGEAVWTPLNVDPVVEQLEGLRGNTGG
ncbi:serine/threonine-protein kinase [Nonomuraea sp. SYSU D8015]|uniref:serine/threonine-protein kinase n=1 Tax=Nonomuraea sp. SYSU D8015 TaxID=2593644 RepID=UPI0016604F4C|nr:serine/threonine-protein kinase [Nonomuraea sp. SYSU D8015]